MYGIIIFVLIVFLVFYLLYRHNEKIQEGLKEEVQDLKDEYHDLEDTIRDKVDRAKETLATMNKKGK